MDEHLRTKSKIESESFVCSMNKQSESLSHVGRKVLTFKDPCYTRTDKEEQYLSGVCQIRHFHSKISKSN